MHIEVREQGKRRLYYLAHSFRDNDKVRKIRRYLGADLEKAGLKALREQAEKSIMQQLEAYRKMSDPLHAALSEREKRELETLIAKGDVRIFHLSEEGWTRFTEAFTYDTNAIEGSTVTAAEVRNILERDQWPDKPKGDISETYGVAEAVRHVRETKERISLALIRKLHHMVFRNSKPFAGRFRGKGIEVVVADRFGNVVHRGAPQKRIPGLLRELIAWYEKNRKNYHPIVLAAVVHNQFENIHPFQDGNGRVGRLLLNYVLLKRGMPPVNIELEKRTEYYLALQAYQRRGDIRPTIELIMKEYRRLRKSLKGV
jgi:fido (protein-threonine AMPylation protein)